MRVLRFAAGGRRTVALGLAVLAATAAPAAAALGGLNFAGQTSQGKPVTLQLGLARKGKAATLRVSRFTIEWYARCQGIKPLLGPLSTFHTDYPFVNDGWKASGTYTDHVKGYVEKFTVRDHAKLDAGTVTGEFTGTVRVTKGSPAKLVTSCRSGTIHFSLHLKA